MIEKAPDTISFSKDMIDIMMSQDYQEELKIIEKDYFRLCKNDFLSTRI